MLDCDLFEVDHTESAPQIVDGQIHGGVAQGIGEALLQMGGRGGSQGAGRIRAIGEALGSTPSARYADRGDQQQLSLGSQQSPSTAILASYSWPLVSLGSFTRVAPLHLKGVGSATGVSGSTGSKYSA